MAPDAQGSVPLIVLSDDEEKPAPSAVTSSTFAFEDDLVVPLHYLPVNQQHM
jgi:hypothetical protein